MTRMTSDIESLTVLFRKVSNFAVQIVTLLVITVYLIILNPHLALILFFSDPSQHYLTLWFRKVSIFGYLNVRTKLLILSNLSESLAGMRVILKLNQVKTDTITR